MKNVRAQINPLVLISMGVVLGVGGTFVSDPSANLTRLSDTLVVAGLSLIQGKVEKTSKKYVDREIHNDQYQIK